TDIECLVDTVGIEYLWQVLFWPAPDTRNIGAIFRLQTDNLNIRVALLEIARYAHDGAGGPHGADKVGQLAAGLFPQLWPSATIMRQRVIQVGELVQWLAFTTGNHRIGQIPCLLHTPFFTHVDQSGAKSRHGLLT